jgi:hypothetical protein
VDERDWRRGKAGSAEAVGNAVGLLELRVGVAEDTLSPGVDDEENPVPGLVVPEGAASDPEPIGSSFSSDME